MISHHHDKEFTYNSNGQLYFSIEDGVASEFYWYGNQLRKIKKINDIIEFQCDDNGYRVSKTIYKNGIEISNRKYIIEGNKILKEIKHFNDDENDYVITYIYNGNEIIGFTYNNSLYIYNKNILGEINEIICRGNVVATYKYDAWGVPMAYRENGTIPDTEATFIGNLNSIKYKGYVYDVETGLFWLSSRYYSPEQARFIQPADVSSLNPQSINGLNLYTYAVNNPIAIKYDSFISSYGSGMVNSIDFGALSTGTSSISNQAAPEWLKLLVGAIPDLKVGLDYLTAHGTKSSFAYATAKTYRFPILGGTHSAFTKGKYSYGDLVGASFRKITTDSARGGFGAFAKNFAKTSIYTLGVNFAFNLYENNWQIDDAMIQDTLIDTAIGVSSYYLAAGTMSLLTTGALVAFGWNVPGLIVVGGVVVLSIAYDALIRWITGYDE